MEFRREIIIDQPIEEVWDIVGNKFGEAYKWASGINYSESYGTPKIEQAHCNNRSCDLASGKIKEVIRVFDPKNYILEYEVIEGFPFFVASGINNWRLTNLDGRTKINMHLVIKTKGIIGAIMNPLMKMQMNGLTKSVLVDLKHYIETGEPSPVKTKELQKSQKNIAA